MRIPTLTRLPVIAALGASLALAACAGEAESDGETETSEVGEIDEAMISSDSDALTGEEIEEAVPGVEEAEPEGETGNTADLGEPSNVEYSDDPQAE